MSKKIKSSQIQTDTTQIQTDTKFLLSKSISCDEKFIIQTPLQPGPVIRKKAIDGEDKNLMMTFDRWFSLQNRLFHHKRGMKAYTNTRGKRSIEEWNRLFKGY